jgi:ubiquinone/menaquinone biosynthesis C-methylase UbiE
MLCGKKYGPPLMRGELHMNNGSIARSLQDARGAYEKTAELYDEVAAIFNQRVMYPHILAALSLFGTAGIRSMKILDAGCGSGNLLHKIRSLGGDAIGIDIARAFLRSAQKKSAVLQSSMHSLPFHAESFDAIVSNFALNYLPPEGQVLALREQFRILRKNGVVAFSCMHPSGIRKDAYFSPMREKRLQMFGETFTLHILDWPEITNAVIASGFRIKKLIDATVPNDLGTIVSSITNPHAAQFAANFKNIPYGIFVIATK